MKRMTSAVNASICLAKSVTAQSVSDREAYEIARDTYVYAHPAMLMDVFMRQGTNYASVPATDRYLMLPQLSLWTDVFACRTGAQWPAASTGVAFIMPQADTEAMQAHLRRSVARPRRHCSSSIRLGGTPRASSAHSAISCAAPRTR